MDFQFLKLLYRELATFCKCSGLVINYSIAECIRYMLKTFANKDLNWVQLKIDDVIITIQGDYLE